MALAFDIFDREIIAADILTGPEIRGSDIRGLMLEAVEARFGTTSMKTFKRDTLRANAAPTLKRRSVKFITIRRHLRSSINRSSGGILAELGCLVRFAVALEGDFRLSPAFEAGVCRPLRSPPGVSGGGPSEDHEAIDVVEDVGEADFGSGPVDPEASDEEAAEGPLRGEDMLDGGAMF